MEEKEKPQSIDKIFDRVAHAKTEKEDYLKSLFISKRLNFEDSFELFFRAFKKEKELEVWVKGEMSEQFILLKKYPICAASGNLGPKRKEGDKQVPEGMYHINRFNPKSKFHLSLGLNYPNESDLFFADVQAPGGDIFIHGNCISEGCLAMRDEPIQEIYLMALRAKELGQVKIPFHIFPMKMMGEKWEKQKEEIPELVSFWNNMKPVFDYFENERQLPEIKVDEGGLYKIIQ